MPAPAQLIFSHFPEIPTWQLIEKQLTRDEFEGLVTVKPTFFKYNLQLLSHLDAVISSTDDVTIRIDCPPQKVNFLVFYYIIPKMNYSFDESYLENFFDCQGNVAI